MGLTPPEYLGQAIELLRCVDDDAVSRACDFLHEAYQSQTRIFVCGNGGSAANANHFAEDLAKLMWNPEQDTRLSVTSLTGAAPFLTALANDEGFESIFEIQLQVHASPGDVLVCISGSGNSPNIVAAAQWAREHDVKVIALTGYDGGQLASLCDVQLHVPSQTMGMLEGVHTLLLDYLGKETRFRAYGVPHERR